MFTSIYLYHITIYFLEITHIIYLVSLVRHTMSQARLHNTRSQSTTADVSSESTTIQPLPLPKDTPEWGVAMYGLLNQHITSSINEVHNKISELINVTVKQAQDKAQEAFDLAESHQS